MQFGCSYSTRPLCMRMSMGSSFGLLTESWEECFPGFSRTQLIIPKSEKILYFNLIYSIWLLFRVLLASIRSLSQHPCPRCLVKKDQIDDMGNKLDARRRKKERVDNDDIKMRVNMTREWIFTRGYGVLSNAVQRKLAPMSLVPTRVCAQVRINSYANFITECLFPTSFKIWFQLLFNVCCRSSSWVWTRCMEGCFHPFDEDFICCRWWLHPDTWQTVHGVLLHIHMTRIINTDSQIPSNPNFQWRHNTSLQ